MRRHVRRRAGFLAVAVAIVPGLVVAGWNAPANVPGIGRDLVAADAGQVAFATSTRASEIVGSAEQQAFAAPATTAFLDRNGCLVLVSGSKIAPASTTGACANTWNGALGRNLTGLTGVVQRVRSLPNGFAYGCDALSGQSNYSAAPDGGDDVWSSLPVDGLWVCSTAMAALRTGTTSYGLFGIKTGTGSNLLLVENGGTQFLTGATSGNALLAPKSVALVEDPAAGVRVFAVNPDGGLDTVVFDGGTAATQSLAVPGVAAFQSVSVAESGTERFGAAIATLSDGGVRLLSAVPNPDPAQFGRAWREFSPGPQGLSGNWKEVHCAGARGCGLYTDSNGTANVVTYANANPPNAPSASATVVSGMDASVTAVSTDPDGEATFVTWTQTSPASPVLPLTYAADGVTVDFSAPVLCDGGVPFQFTLSAQDGLPGHVTQGQATIVVSGALPPAAPSVQEDPLAVDAGASPVTVHVLPSPSECSNWTYAWSPAMTPNGISAAPSADGLTAVLTFPAHVCDPAGITDTFAVAATSAWATSDAGTFTVHVNPWGAPEAPFPQGTAPATQLAGTTRSWARAATHVCDDGGVNAPQVTTTWTVDGGLPPGTTLSPDPRATGTAQADAIDVISTDRCDHGTFTLWARNEVGGSPPSDWSSLPVELQADLDPLESAALSIALTGPGVSGTSAVAINCPDLRTMTATFVIDDQGTVLRQSQVVVPGPWSLPDPDAVCTPRQMAVYAVLDGTDGGVRSNEVAIDPPLANPGVGALDAGPFIAACEAGRVVASGPLSHDRGGAGCLDQQTLWTGADLSNAPLTGDAVTGTVEGASWDDVLNRAVSVTATATAGANASAPKEATGVVEPAGMFVSAQMASDAPVASETGILGLRITLHNESGCAVTDGRFVLRLDGVTYVDGTARVSGEGTVEIPHVSLAPGASQELTLNVRPTLFGNPAPRGQFFVGDTAVSAEVALGQRVATTGCGCGGTGSSTSALALWGVLLALGAQVRRRARSRS